MKTKIITILSIVLTLLTSCGDLNEKAVEIQSDEHNSRVIFTTPINYDYDNLRLRLNSSIDDSISNIEWRWDYMNSDNGMPDTTGIDHYMNINQPVFSFNGETTLPSLSITTDKKRITRFSSTIIFNLKDEKPESIKTLLDSLSIIDLLEDKKVRQSILNDHIYKTTNDNFEETIELQISEEEYGYDRITYEIKITPHNKTYTQ
ncbi:hypothetical protein GYB29_07420 [bacterium]|nr:hypothetical protein [bacterium]